MPLYPDKRRGLRGAHIKDDDVYEMMGGENTTGETKKYYVVRSWLIDMLLRTTDANTITNFSEYTANIQQVLHILNKDLPLFSGALSGSGGTLDAMLQNGWTTSEMIDELFLASVSRFPTEAEKDRCLGHLRNAKTRETGYEEIFWALLNTDEFIFNH